MDVLHITKTKLNTALEWGLADSPAGALIGRVAVRDDDGNIVSLTSEADFKAQFPDLT